METKMKGAFGWLWWIIVLLVVACAIGFFIYNGDDVHKDNSTNQKQVAEQNDQVSWEVAMKKAGIVSDLKIDKLPEGQKSPDCVDYRDGGEDIYVKWSTYSKWKLRQEYCNFADAKPNTHVSEFSCSYEDPIADHWIECQYGCSDGACLKEPAKQATTEKKMVSADAK